MSELVENIAKKFEELFYKKPLIVRSPGRVNLIGEHTDYNEGFVLPAAIDKKIIFAISPREDHECNLFAYDLNDDYKFTLNKIEKSGKGWPDYLIGVIQQLQYARFSIKGFDCVFGGDIPIGAGLSSSAAIEAGLMFALNEIYELDIEKLFLVKLAQKAENEFVGVQCGIMDQFINIFGRDNKALKLDCRSLAYEYYPFDQNEFKIVLCDTKVEHSLADSEYNVRRKQCEDGVELLSKYNPKINSLRDVSLELLNKHKDEINPVIYKRCEYVIEENKRVELACKDLQKNDIVSFGKRMYESHYGLRDEYEVSCKELDVLVEIAEKNDSVIGARMMGGGFGGCTINLVKKDSVEDFINSVKENYKKQIGNEPEIYITEIHSGTDIIKSLAEVK